MPQVLYGLSQHDIDRLRELLRQWEMGALVPAMSQRRSVLGDIDRVIVGLLEGEVSAATLTGDPTTGTLNIYSVTSTGGTSDTGVDQGVYHFAPVAATTDRWTMAIRNNPCGSYMIMYQGCTA